MKNKDENPNQPETAQAPDDLTSSSVLVERAEDARKALLDRPRISLRLQLYLGFFIAYLLAIAIAGALVYIFHRVESRIRFLEVVNEYAIEVEQARRYEKNFFLYGTNLVDALDNVYKAEQILIRNSGELVAVLGTDWKDIMLPSLHRYRDLLESLGKKKDEAQTPAFERMQKEQETLVRKQGQQMTSAAQALLQKEKDALGQTLSHSRQFLILALVFLLLVVVLNAYILSTHILRALKRFGTYANRIAAGDYTPITPARRYRDEFTDLSLTINTMIAELERREAILIQSHKMRAVGTLTAGVAHELNNPLNNITLTAHVLQEDFDGLSDEEKKEMIDDVVGEAGRAKKIILNLLDFARETGSVLEPLQIQRLLQETIDLAANQIKLMGVKIEFQATENLPRVHGDSQQLRQVFLNLILNAIDASQKGGKIEILVVPADEPNYVAVKVIDHGSGIPDHILPSIFDPFFTTKARGKGTGLGLSVSQGIVTKHGGRIMVSSLPESGTTFSVVLPVTTIPAELEG